MKREYFYNENGVMKPYHYCTNCGKRHTDDQFRKLEIINIGTQRTPMKYCNTDACLGKVTLPTYKNGNRKLKRGEIDEPTAESMQGL